MLCSSNRNPVRHSSVQQGAVWNLVQMLHSTCVQHTPSFHIWSCAHSYTLAPACTIAQHPCVCTHPSPPEQREPFCADAIRFHGDWLTSFIFVERQNTGWLLLFSDGRFKENLKSKWDFKRRKEKWGWDLGFLTEKRTRTVSEQERSGRVTRFSLSSPPQLCISVFFPTGAGMVWRGRRNCHRFCGTICHPIDPDCQRNCWSMAGKQTIHVLFRYGLRGM